MSNRTPKMPRKNVNSTQNLDALAIMKALMLPAGLLALASLASPLSQLVMAPIYGAIPSAVNHKHATKVSLMFSFLLKFFWKTKAVRQLRYYLAAWAACLPLLQSQLFKFSGSLGPVIGPILSGSLSCHTLIVLSAYSAAVAVEPLYRRVRLGFIPASIVAPAVALGYFTVLEKGFSELLPRYAQSLPLSPAGLQHCLPVAYTTLSPDRRISSVILAATLLLWSPLITGSGSTRLDTALRTQNWSLVARHWSNTGYISVLDNLDQQYRVLRCDHSLLGGEWLLTDQRRKLEGWKVNEPIYAVFEMLEAVRLMEVQPAIVDSEAKALVIGLGIGTAPKALISHGMNATIIELDPLVHGYATKYFDLPTNHQAVLRDAVSWVSQETKALSYVKSYDYIIHDVFTGGAEPLALFTEDFIRNLRLLLRSNGLIAINYAGDLSTALTGLVLNTIDVVFEGQCKIFTDATLGRDLETGPDAQFSNIVVFCRNSPGPITFRQPQKADFLQSQSRKQYLYPKPEMEVPFPFRGGLKSLEVLKAGTEHQYSRSQVSSATQHWHIMRKVLPDAIWSLY